MNADSKSVPPRSPPRSATWDRCRAASLRCFRLGGANRRKYWSRELSVPTGGVPWGEIGILAKLAEESIACLIDVMSTSSHRRAMTAAMSAWRLRLDSRTDWGWSVVAVGCRCRIKHRSGAVRPTATLGLRELLGVAGRSDGTDTGAVGRVSLGVLCLVVVTGL